MPNNSHRTRDHLANERTFLAWIRTSLGIMVFGFVVEKFSLFIKHVLPWFGNTNAPIPPKGSVFGVFLVIFGVLICLLAFIRFKNVEKQIEDESYQPSLLLNIMLTLAVLSIGVFLVIFLNNNI